MKINGNIRHMVKKVKKNRPMFKRKKRFSKVCLRLEINHMALILIMDNRLGVRFTILCNVFPFTFPPGSPLSWPAPEREGATGPAPADSPHALATSACPAAVDPGRHLGFYFMAEPSWFSHSFFLA